MHLVSRLKKIVAAAFVIAPAMASAAPYTLTIDGVDPNSPPDVLAPGYTPTVRPGMFVALGNCVQAVGVSGACDVPQTVPVDLNTLATPTDVQNYNTANVTNLTNAVIFGYGLNVDQLIFHAFQSSFTVSGGNIVLPPGAVLEQTFEYLVGSTGGGSAGPGPDTFVAYDFSINRNVTISGGSLASPITQMVTQSARLTVGWTFDTLEIFGSDLLTFDLGADGQVQLRLLAEGPIQQGDPEVPIVLTSVVPVPPTVLLALLALGLMGFTRRRAAC
jgi:hypothetical protein